MNALSNPRKQALISQDTGRTRTLSDLFSIHSKTHAAVLGQAAPLFRRVE